MAQYRDTAGQVHTLRITLAHRRPIIDATEWDLLELAHKPERLDAFLKDRKSTRLNSSHMSESRMPSSA